MFSIALRLRPTANSAAVLCGLLSATAWAGDCPEEVQPRATLDGISGLLDAAERVIDTEAPKKLNQRMGPVRVEVGCLSQLLTPQLSARIHRLRAIQADPLGVALQKPQVLGSLKAARRLEPDFDLTSLLPASHGLVAAYAVLEPTTETTRMVRPKTGSLAFDGNVSRDRPLDMATLYQRLDDAGIVVETQWLAPGAAIPRYDEKKTRSIGLLLASGGLAATGLGLLTGAMASEARFKSADNGLDLAGLDQLRATSNTLFISGIGLTVLAGGAATTAVIMETR